MGLGARECGGAHGRNHRCCFCRGALTMALCPPGVTLAQTDEAEVGQRARVILVRGAVLGGARGGAVVLALTSMGGTSSCTASAAWSVAWVG